MNRWGASAVAGAALIVGAVAAPGSFAATAGPAPAHACKLWRMHTVASGLGILESLLPDNQGGMLLSSSTNNAVERLAKNGDVTTVVSASSPGQLVWHGKRILLPTGDGVESGALNRADGTLELLNLATGKVQPYADHLTMPNGLALGPGGAAYVTRDTGTGTGITRIGVGKRHKVKTQWAKLSDTNGIAVDRKRKVMYVDRTFTQKAPVIRIPLRHPGRAKQVANFVGLGSAAPKGLDDLIRARGGVLYVPGNSSGEVFSYDPKTDRACLIASGLQNPSATAIGTGHGWRKGSVFVCGFDGTVRRLDPPKQ
ncbi:MAG: hypothetical protein JO246_17740 [Frankiaceae bacterium]|nr:hypothetical protein [Frankiaceae bacterium]